MKAEGCILLVVLDGAGDLPCPDLNGMTPLEASGMRNLNRIISRCSAGSMYPIGKGIAPESDAAVMSLLGYDVGKEYTGRGPLEAFGAGLEVKGDCLAVRCNFATVDKSGTIIDRRAGRNVTQEDSKSLEGEINRVNIDGVSIEFKATVGHRGALLIRPGNRMLSSNISNADIGYVKSGNISVASEAGSAKIPEVEALDASGEAKYTAGILNEFIAKSIAVLGAADVNRKRVRDGKLPANALLMRDAGLGLPKVRKFEQKFGLKAAFVADMPVERGISKLAGMTELHVETSMPNTEKYGLMAKMVKENVDKFDFIYVHIKGPDEPGHDGEAPLKKERLEEIDGVFFGGIIGMAKDITLCVTADHSTPCTLKRHSGDPVPIVIKSRSMDKNNENVKFSEAGTRGGSLGAIKGIELISLLKKYR